MARGIRKDLNDTPILQKCFCGKQFRKWAPSQIYCSSRCRLLAFLLRRLLPDVPVVPPPQKPSPPASSTPDDF